MTKIYCKATDCRYNRERRYVYGQKVKDRFKHYCGRDILFIEQCSFKKKGAVVSQVILKVS